MNKIDSFISKDTFKSLAGCILVVEACTECIKFLFPDVNCGLWVAFIFSVAVSFVRLTFNEDYSKETIILTIINTLPIFLGSVGIYQAGIKTITKLLSY